MRLLVLLLASAFAWGGDCRDVWHQIQRGQPAPWRESGCNPDFYDRLGRSPLIAALDAKSSPALLVHLFKAGARPDFPSRYGNPPLIWAIIAGPDWLRQLLANGATPVAMLDFGGPLFSGFDISQRYAGRVPSLFLAAWLQNGTAQMLFDRGVRLDATDSGRVLDDLVALPETELEILLRSGFDLHARNSRGQTLLHEAVRLKKTALIELLMRHGANVQERNVAGQSALDLARQLQRRAELACLERHICR